MIDRERGATITEVLIVLAVSGIVSAALLLALERGIRTETAISAELEQNRQAAWITELLVDDLRESELDTSVVGSVDLSQAIALRSTDEAGVVHLMSWFIERSRLWRQTTSLETGRTGLVDFGAATSFEVRYADTDDRDVRLSQRSDIACVRLVEVRIGLSEEEGEGLVAATVAPATERSE